MPSDVEVRTNPVLNNLIIFLGVFDVDIVRVEVFDIKNSGRALGELSMARFELALEVRQTVGNLRGHLVGPELLLDVSGVGQEAGVEVVAVKDVVFGGDMDEPVEVQVGEVGARSDLLARINE